MYHLDGSLWGKGEDKGGFKKESVETLSTETTYLHLVDTWEVWSKYEVL